MVKVTMRFEELAGLLADFTQVGFMEAVRAYAPAQDRVRKSEVKKWLKMMLVDYKDFKALENCGHIHARRKGKSINSPLYYSKKEIMSVLKAKKLLSVLTKSED